MGAAWAWGMVLIVAKVVQQMHYIRHGAPDYKYLKRMESALAAHNLSEALERERERVP
jgi:hypothetical protein